MGITCGYCGAEVPQLPGKRKKLHCNNVHKQLVYKRRKKAATPEPEPSVQQTTYTAMLSELTEVHAQVDDQAKEIYRLRQLLDVEKRYLIDMEQRGFKGFLKNLQTKTPFVEKLLADQFFRPRDTRAHYEYHLRRLKYSDEELDEFQRLWKLMLLSQI